MLSKSLSRYRATGHRIIAETSLRRILGTSNHDDYSTYDGDSGNGDLKNFCPSRGVPDCSQMLKTVGGGTAAASAQWAPTPQFDRSSKFHTFSTSPLLWKGRETDRSRNTAEPGLGGCAGPGPVSSTLGRRRAGSRLTLRPNSPAHLLWLDIMLFSSEISGWAAAGGAAADHRVACANLLAVGRLVDAISRL